MKISSRLPRELSHQLLRAVLSIILNIAEGSAKKSDKDFARFLENALGSANEVVAGLDVAADDRALHQKEFEQLLNHIESIAKQLGGFIKKLKNS